MRRSKNIFGALFVLLLFAVWLFLLYSFKPTEIVDIVGTENSYILVFVLAIIGGTSVLFPFPYYLVVFTLGSGGLNPFLIGLLAGTGVAMGDSTSYLIGYSGREIITGKIQKIFNRLHKWCMKKPKAVTFLFLYLYSSFMPLPNDVIVMPMGMARFPYLKLIIPLWLGNVTFNIAVALTGFYGIYLYGLI
jgi:membrane protein DedA with SNARE-associated domain